MQMRKMKALRQELQDNTKIKACADRFGVVGDCTRLKICYLLCHYPELPVSEIAKILNAPISTVSHSLKKLKEIHAVVNRRSEKEIFYSLSRHQFAKILKDQLLSKKYE